MPKICRCCQTNEVSPPDSEYCDSCRKKHEQKSHPYDYRRDHYIGCVFCGYQYSFYRT